MSLCHSIVRASCWHRLRPLTALVLLILVSAPATAAFNCRLTTTPLGFGTYVPGTASHVDTTAQLRVRCRGGQGVARVTLGTGLSSNSLDRQMSSGNDVLRYNLFFNASHTVIWGDGAGATQAITISHPRGRARNYRPTIYGRIFSNQDPADGVYGDSILVTVEF
jgi:spore coat protein U-like protein